MHIPEAYESLILDILRGEQANFVRDDELTEAWRIFTPVLHEIECDHVQPEIYPAGSRGPQSADDRLLELGFRRSQHHTQQYSWPKQPVND
jgi:glucose-6-phosphate 1-dehydrogenase